MKIFDSLNKRSGVILNSAKQLVFATNTHQNIWLQKKSRILNFSKISKSTRNKHTYPNSRFWIHDFKKIIIQNSLFLVYLTSNHYLQNTHEKFHFQKKSRILNFSEISKSTRKSHIYSDSRLWIHDLKKIIREMDLFLFYFPSNHYLRDTN